jgi:DDE superfamily endonuclease
MATNTSLEAQEEWKRGLGAALIQAGVKLGQGVWWSDEMRLGLLGQVRRVWGIRGIKIRQKVELKYEWRNLALAVDVMQGELRWQWTPNLKKETVRQVVTEWQGAGVEALVWDRAPGHGAKIVEAVGLPLVKQPPASPELNPAERVFEELRREVEGEVYGTIEKKMAAVAGELEAMAASPERVQRLTGWSWIREALAQWPQEFTALS